MLAIQELHSITTLRGKRHYPNGFFFFMIIIFGIVMVLTWREVVRKKANKKYTLTDKRIKETLKELEKTEKCEVYYLTARANAWYMCYLCNNGSYYLYAGEIWKIGMTCNPGRRYKHDWLQQMNLWYEPVFKGDMKACREEEIKRISKFPLSVQNMRRSEKDRLVVPPGHGTTRLK
jgi:hypothetical protein